MIELIDV